MALISLDLHYITLFLIHIIKFWAGFYELLGWKSSIQSGNTGCDKMCKRPDVSVHVGLCYFFVQNDVGLHCKK